MQCCRWGLLFWSPAAGLQTEGAYLGAAKPDRQHQHWRSFGVIHSVTNQLSSAASCLTQGDSHHHQHCDCLCFNPLFGTHGHVIKMMMITKLYWLLIRNDKIVCGHTFLLALLLSVVEPANMGCCSIWFVFFLVLGLRTSLGNKKTANGCNPNCNRVASFL